MKATLFPRKKIRLRWFEMSNIPFEIDRELEFSYNLSTVQNDKITYNPNYWYVFKEVNKEIPGTEIILLQKGLPILFTRTVGSIANKFSTNKQNDSTISINDQIIKIEKGKEEIKREPLQYPDPKIKEMEIRTRIDTIIRKLTFKNESDKKISGLKVKFIEVKDVRYSSSKQELYESDPPEYIWSIDIEPDSSKSLEITLIVEIVKTFKIEKDVKIVENKQ